MDDQWQQVRPQGDVVRHAQHGRGVHACRADSHVALRRRRRSPVPRRSAAAQLRAEPRRAVLVRRVRRAAAPAAALGAPDRRAAPRGQRAHRRRTVQRRRPVGVAAHAAEVEDDEGASQCLGVRHGDVRRRRGAGGGAECAVARACAAQRGHVGDHVRATRRPAAQLVERGVRHAVRPVPLGVPQVANGAAAARGAGARHRALLEW
mmetsp:Transcript_56800/g.139698  ORF Transcript_56800/g.139698 Transcript_56800/m.139698 type:complete len:206 (-) Transcript_56800:189-806(-)